MKFYIIYSFDTPKGISVSICTPPKKHLWTLTEQGSSEFEYLEGEWIGGKHRKYTAILNKKEFNNFINYAGLYMEDTETMGSITEYGHLPAIAFNGDSQECIESAYVTPFPDIERKSKPTQENEEKCWNRIKKAMLNLYS